MLNRVSEDKKTSVKLWWSMMPELFILRQCMPLLWPETAQALLPGHAQGTEIYIISLNCVKLMCTSNARRAEEEVPSRFNIFQVHVAITIQIRLPTRQLGTSHAGRIRSLMAACKHEVVLLGLPNGCLPEFETGQVKEGSIRFKSRQSPNG